MKQRRRLQLFGAWLIAAVVGGGGCSALTGGDHAEGMKLKEPDAKFFKKVEADSFPRANAMPAARR
jgi:hypothetical protein